MKRSHILEERRKLVNPLRFFKYGMVFFIRPDRKFTILSKVQRTEHPARRVFDVQFIK